MNAKHMRRAFQILPGDVDHIMSGHDLPAIDLASWMGQLSPQLRSIPIIFLAIPGSHDSLMYKVMRRSPVAPDAPQHLHLWNVLVPGIVRRWVQTQELEAGAQLELGVRYFDIRASYLGGNFMICHGLYSGDSLQPLHEINLFLDQHPTEVVILDFQHVYNATAEQHQSYCDTIAAIFGNKILPRLGNSLTKCSLDDMTASGKQVIVIYRYLCDRDALFWGGQDWPTPWPNTVKVKTLQQFLADSIQERDKEKGYVSQCILTPSGRFIVRNLGGSIKSSCARPVLKNLMDWLAACSSGPCAWPTYNVFIADFVNLQDAEFCKTVIRINQVIEEIINRSPEHKHSNLKDAKDLY